MKTKTYTVAEIMAGCDRPPEELLREIGDRIDYRCFKIDGTYELPSDDPFMADVLRMIGKRGKPRRFRAEKDSDASVKEASVVVRCIPGFGLWEPLRRIPQSSLGSKGFLSSNAARFPEI